MSRAELIRLREHKTAAYPFSLVYYQGQTESGRAKRRRLFFKTRKAAEAEMRIKKIELLGAGIVHEETTDEERRAVVYAREQFATLPPRTDGGIHSIVDAVADYCARIRRDEKTITVSAFLAHFLDYQKKLGKHPRTIGDLKSRLERYAGDYGDRTVRSITKPELQSWVLGLDVGAKTKANYRKLLSWFFSAAVEDGYAETNFAKYIDVPSAITKRESLTPAEMRALLGASPERLRASIVLGGFCGLRDSEISRLVWEKNIDLEQGLIEITTDITKTKQHRHVEIPPNALAWLGSINTRKGRVVPANARRLEELARRAAAFGKPGTESKEEKDAGIQLRPWPTNALRHSAATYRLLATQNADATALWLGNSAEILKANYRSLIKPAVAAEWWGIYPPSAKPSTDTNVIKFKPATSAAS